MALIGNRETNFGLNAGYHNISAFSWEKSGSLVIQVDSFLDEAARYAKSTPLLVSRNMFSNVLNNSQISFAELYTMLKSLPQFSAMIDG